MINIRQNKNIGKSKYVVSYNLPGKTHPDGSDFYDVRIFSNKKDKEKFFKELNKL